MVDGFNQINLFDDTEEKVSLYSALDKIRLRFGNDLIMPACGQLRSEKLEKQESRKFEKMMAAAKRQ